jgi:sugar phosphate isomerase/epimerase
MKLRKKTIATAFIAQLALGGLLHAERELSVFDNGLTALRTAEEQAALLQKLGYDGICTRPEKASDELFTAMDRHGIMISATYVALPAKADPQVPPGIADHIRKLKGRKTLVWLAITNDKADENSALSLIREVCDLASANDLEVVLYPHVGFLTDTLAECERLRKLADRPNLGISFNLCHHLCQDGPATIEAALKDAAPHLKLVQISGADEIPPGKPDWRRLIQPLDKGTFDMRRVLRTLDSIGYKGPVNLQCYQIKQPAGQHLAASMEAWKKLNKNITTP